WWPDESAAPFSPDTPPFASRVRRRRGHGIALRSRGLRGRALRREDRHRPRGARAAPILRCRALPPRDDLRARHGERTHQGGPEPARAHRDDLRVQSRDQGGTEAFATGDGGALRSALRDRAPLPRRPRPPDRDPPLAPGARAPIRPPWLETPSSSPGPRPRERPPSPSRSPAGSARRSFRWTRARSTAAWTSGRPRSRPKNEARSPTSVSTSSTPTNAT